MEKSKRKYYLAIDIGASSGRHIIGWQEDDKIEIKELYRFANGMEKKDGHLVWNIDNLFAHIKEGIKVAFNNYPHIESLAIDTWGVDYVLMSGSEIISPCYAYRDDRTATAIEVVKEKVGSELYSRTGIQFQPFNTIYQLTEDFAVGRLRRATDFLMMPEFFNYLLTGKKLKEYTNASTTGLINAHTKEFDFAIIDKLGLPSNLFGELHYCGETVGELTPDIAKEVGGNTLVKLAPSHDTAAAFFAVDTDEESIFLSSGTWSLIGAKLPKPVTSDLAKEYNFTNEGGVGYIRFLKNITGMWINVNLQKEFGYDFGKMTEMARESDYQGVFDVNDSRFSAPQNMTREIAAYFEERRIVLPKTAGDYFKTAYLSLAHAYKKAIDEVSECTGKTYRKLYIVGGGAKNGYLNELTEKLTGLSLVPLPIEATAIGNIKSQM